MNFKKILIFFFATVILCSCEPLKQPTIVKYEPIISYKYAIVSPTNALTSGTGGAYGSQFGLFGFSESESINPSDIISGYLMKKGFIIIPAIEPQLANETLIISYGEKNRRKYVFEYAYEISLQFISAKDHEIVCACTSEASGNSRIEGLKNAILQALDISFSTK